MATAEVKSSPRNLFLTGKIRTYESDLFDRGRFVRLIEHEGLSAFINDLSDTKYGDSIKEHGFDPGLKRYFYGLYRYFRKNMGYPETIDIFMLNDDIINLVEYVMGTGSGEDRDTGFGVFGTGWLEGERLPELLSEVMDRVGKMISQEKPEPVHTRLIEKTVMDMVEEKYLEGIPDRRIKELWKYRIDLHNLLARLDLEDERYYWKGGWIEPGYWDTADLKDDIPEKLKSQPYGRIIEKVKDGFKLESELKSWLSGYLKDMRKTTFGVEQIVAFMLSLLEEIRNLQMIRTGINIKIDRELLKERLNLAYV